MFMQLKQNKDGRYDFLQMNRIFEEELGFDTRGCEKELEKLGYNVDYSIERYGCGEKYCDFWHYQLDAMFRNKIHNGSNNFLYVGTKNGLNLKKLKKQPRDWELMMVEKWNELFNHLADEHGWVRICIRW